MKKSIAIVAALAVTALSAPLISGCSASVGYIKKTDGSGNEYYSVSVDGNASYLGGELVIPSQYEGLPVKEVEAGAFTNAMYTKITIPASIEKVGTAAFSYNFMLEEVTFEEGSALGEIVWGMFGYCSKLQQINVPDSVKTIDGYAFYGCAFQDFEFPEGLEYINARAFEGCVSLKELNLPQTLKRIGNLAFYNCASLKELVLPDSLADAEEPVLDENGEPKVENGNPVTEFVPALGTAAFHTCTSLKSVKVGKGITVIEPGAFGYCSALEEIYLPAGITTIYGSVLNGDGDLLVGHAFHHDGALANIYFAGTQEQWSAVKIENYAISSNSSLYDNSAVLNANVEFNVEY